MTLRSVLISAVALAFALAPFGRAVAQFPAVLELTDITNGDFSEGYSGSGESAGDSFGAAVSAAGDVNGDGFGDLVISAIRADPNGEASGLIYVTFGTASGLPSPFTLSVISGETANDFAGLSVSSAGDINGDGFDDLLIGAPGRDNTGAQSGSTYVVYGAAAGLPSFLQLSDLDGSNGFVINGEEEFDQSGHSVSRAGDVNADGLDDLIIGAPMANPNGDNSGRSYVLFGTLGGFPNPFGLTSLDGTNGFAINGEGFNERSGGSVSAAGDINGDGIDDLVIGAEQADPNGLDSGRSYVVFGSNSGLPDPFELSSLDGSNGFVIDGEAAGDQSGFSVSGAGDVNGDGVDDLLIGAPDADPNGLGSGRSYVIFGTTGGFPNPFPLSGLNGSNGFVINGNGLADQFGSSVSGAGDVNGDGVDDLLVGAFGASPNGSISGQAVVIFGSTTAVFASPFELSSLDGNNGFVINGEAAEDTAGSAVSNAGDVNGDGLGDLIIGAEFADGSSGADAGRNYVIFGRPLASLPPDDAEPLPPPVPVPLFSSIGVLLMVGLLVLAGWVSIRACRSTSPGH